MEEKLEIIRQTNNSILYKTVRSDIAYILKENIHEYSDNGIENEMTKSKKVYNNSQGKEICIPITDIEEKNGKKYAVMQYKICEQEQGYFLSELIRTLEKRYAEIIPVDIQIALLEAILKSLKVLHYCKDPKDITKCGFIHLDLHPGNIYFESISINDLPNDIGIVKFIDWQNSLEINENGYAESKKRLGITPGFSSPEHMYNGYYTKASDMYSVSAICARMYTGKILSSSTISYYDIVNDEQYNKCSNPVVHYLMKSMLLYGLDENEKYRYQNTDDMLKMLGRIKLCYNSFINGNYYKLFSSAYEAKVPARRINVVNLQYNKDKLQDSFKLLNEELHNANIDAEKCYYIAMLLLKIIKCNNVEYNPDFYSDIISACNHNGESKMANEIRKLMSIQDQRNAVNKSIIIYEDNCDYQKGYDEIEKHKADVEEVVNVIRGQGRCDRISEKELGVTYSSCGRFAAYLSCLKKNNNDEPYKYFELALGIFENIGDVGDGSDYEITLGHYLQYAIEKGDVDTFKKYEDKYFGEHTYNDKETLKNWLEIVFTKRDKNGRLSLYKIYTLLKAVYNFENTVSSSAVCSSNNISTNFIRFLIKYIEEIELPDRHPTEFIYKYIALLLYRYKSDYEETQIDDEIIHSIFEKSLSVCNGLNSDEPIIVLIHYQTKWLYNHYCYDDLGNEELLQLLKKYGSNIDPDSIKDFIGKIKSHNEIRELLFYEHN